MEMNFRTIDCTMSESITTNTPMLKFFIRLHHLLLFLHDSKEIRRVFFYDFKKISSIKFIEDRKSFSLRFKSIKLFFK